MIKKILKSNYYPTAMYLLISITLILILFNLMNIFENSKNSFNTERINSIFKDEDTRVYSPVSPNPKQTPHVKNQGFLSMSGIFFIPEHYQELKILEAIENLHSQSFSAEYKSEGFGDNYNNSKLTGFAVSNLNSSNGSNPDISDFSQLYSEKTYGFYYLFLIGLISLISIVSIIIFFPKIKKLT